MRSSDADVYNNIYNNNIYNNNIYNNNIYNNNDHQHDYNHCAADIHGKLLAQ